MGDLFLDIETLDENIILFYASNVRTISPKWGTFKERSMANKRFWLGILVMALVFGMMVVGCPNEIVAKAITCSVCEGTGKCQKCGGDGKVYLLLTCSECKGSGKCQACDGTGISSK
jgi:hypothetical protein